MSGPNAQSLLTPTQRYAVAVARMTVAAQQAYGTEGMVKGLAAGPGDMSPALVFAYGLAVHQLRQLLAIIDMLTGAS